MSPHSASEAASSDERAIPSSRLFANNYQSASNKMPRLINRNLIFNQIRTRQPISRADLARTSGLQRSTVSLIVEELLAEGWIVEGQTASIPRGRRPTFLQLNGTRSVLALDVHPAQTTLALTDLGGKILDQIVVELPSDPQKVIGAIVHAISGLIAAHGGRTFDGIGISLPGRFDPKSEKMIFAPNVHWPIGRIKSRVEKATGLRVIVDNVANACALSEVWFGYADSLHDLVVVNVSEGVGTGIFANGRLLRGEGGVAGEFGHAQLDPAGLPCGCGNRGCWETVASNRAGLRYYSELSGKLPASFDELLRLAAAEDPAAREAIEKMCRALGRGMHMIASMLAPNEIVVVGDIAALWPWTGALIEEEMRKMPLVRVPRLRAANEGSTARLRSAVALIMNEHLL
jgi:predicted NBD/HSP70 family sugar kinase